MEDTKDRRIKAALYTAVLDHADHIEELMNIIVKKVEIKDAIQDVKSIYFQQPMAQSHVKDEKKSDS